MSLYRNGGDCDYSLARWTLHFWVLVCGVGLGVGLGVGWVEYYLGVTRWGQEINQEVCEFGKNKNFEMTILPFHY